MTDLSRCQAVFERDPALYLDMTEPVRRGTGRVLYAAPEGALVAVSNQDDNGVLYTMFAQNEAVAEHLCSLIPIKPEFVTIHEAHSFPALRRRFGYQSMTSCWQVGYLAREPLDLPPSRFQIRPLTMDHQPLVEAHYQLTDGGYLSGRIALGALYGAFDGANLAGFIGFHAEGTVGLLEVLPNYRRQGIATLLQSYLTNLELSRGHIPYGQVFDGNEPSLALQRSLGYQRSAGLMYWSEL